MERVGKIQMCKFLLAIKHDPSICLSLIYDKKIFFKLMSLFV